MKRLYFYSFKMATDESNTTDLKFLVIYLENIWHLLRSSYHTLKKKR